MALGTRMVHIFIYTAFTHALIVNSFRKREKKSAKIKYNASVRFYNSVHNKLKFMTLSRKLTCAYKPYSCIDSVMLSVISTFLALNQHFPLAKFDSAWSGFHSSVEE